MTHVLSSCPFAYPLHFKPCSFKPQLPSSFTWQSSCLVVVCCKFSWNWCSTNSVYKLFNSTRRPPYAVRDDRPMSYQSMEWDDMEDVEDTGSPWEGAIIYKRNPSVTHFEYCTTLERLGLGQLSTDLSKSKASTMGLRVTTAVKDYPQGTPVLVSIDVTRKKQKLRLDGIIRTVITLACNRCAEPAAESVFSNFSLLLSEQPIEEPDIINIGTTFGEDKSIGRNGDEDDDDDDALIDWDDRLYFPSEEKEIDISKNIRDMVHLEITINAICDAKCKGICLKCGTNLNNSKCICTTEEAKERSYGPLGNLRKQMERK